MHEAIGAERLYLAPGPVPEHVPDIVVVDERTLMRQRLLFALTVLGVPTVGTMTAVASLRVLPFGWPELIPLVILMVITGLGIEVGFHRLFTHHAFTTGTPTRVFLAIAGSMALEGPVMYWVAHHRRHHEHPDHEGDPHSPHLMSNRLAGVWHAHVGWIFQRERACVGRYARDLLRDPAIVRVDRAYSAWLLLSFLLPAAVGLGLRGSWQGALSGLLWAGCARVFLVQHVTYAVNSVGHLVGEMRFRSAGESRDLSLLALPSFGGFLHNTHHAFPASARNSTRWYDLDSGYWFIRFLELTGLATDVHVPTPEMLARRRLSSSRRRSEPPSRR